MHKYLFKEDCVAPEIIPQAGELVASPSVQGPWGKPVLSLRPIARIENRIDCKGL